MSEMDIPKFPLKVYGEAEMHHFINDVVPINSEIYLLVYVTKVSHMAKKKW